MQNNHILLSELSSTGVYEQYHDPIYRYILRLVHESGEAEDLTQETFLRAHQHLDTLQSSAALRSWVYRIATHVCYDRFRQASFRKEAGALVDPNGSTLNPIDGFLEGPDELTLEQVIDREEMRDCIETFIGRLADDYRTTILLHDIHGMTCSEISQILACSLETTKNASKAKLPVSPPRFLLFC